MKISEIQPGKRYWKRQTKMDGRTRHKEVIGIKVYVIQVDIEKNRVLASLNGTPAEWFSKASFGRWQTEDPTTKKLK